MNESDLVTSIGNTLTKLDTMLKSPALNDEPAQWQQVFAQRKSLDDQQRDLVKTEINADDAGFKAYTGLIDAATKQLDQQIASMKSIDGIIHTVAQISANLDDILKLA